MTFSTRLLLLLLFSKAAFAQNKLEFKLIDDKQQAVSFCPVALLKVSDSTLIKGNVSNEQGEIIFENISKGTYLIKATAVGFSPYFSSEIVIDSLSQLKLEPITLSSSAQNLKEVSVIAFKPTVEFKKGMIVLNADNELITKGNTVLDLLKRLPGVVVDAQNNITVNGNGNVRFMMDGRLQQMPPSQMIMVLSGMSAETIKSLELIKNPPARYDAAGTGGMINIVTKKASLKGFNGFVAQSYSQGKREREWNTLGLSYKNNKLSLFSNINGGYIVFEDETELDRVLNTTATTNAFNASGTIVNKRKMGNINLGAEYDFTPKTSVGIYFNDAFNNSNPVQNAKTTVFEGDAFNYSTFTYKTDHNQVYNVPTVNASLLHKLDSLGSQIQYQGDYSNTIGEERKVTDNHFYDALGNEVVESSHYKTDIHSDYKITNHKIDLTKHFKKELSLETGVKGGWVDINSSTNLELHNKSVGFYSGDTLFDNNYNYKEQILAAYATLNKNFKKVGLSLGLRGEETDIHATNLSTNYKFSRSYFNVFPSGSMDIRFNPKNTLTTSYSYRIDRPGYDMMNPVRVFNDQLNYSVGNSELKPQYTHYVTADYNYNNFMTTSIGYHRTLDFTFFYTYTMENSQVNIDTIFNFPTRNNFIISEFIQKQVKWYNFQLYGQLEYRNFTGTINGQNVGSETFQTYFSLNNEIRLPKDFKIQIFGFYGSKFHDGPQTYYPIGNLTIGVNKGFFSNKLNVTLTMNDIFWTERGWHSSKLSDQYYYYGQRPDTRRFRINLNWKFGKMRIEQKLNKSEDNSRFNSKATK